MVDFQNDSIFRVFNMTMKATTWNRSGIFMLHSTFDSDAKTCLRIWIWLFSTAVYFAVTNFAVEGIFQQLVLKGH